MAWRADIISARRIRPASSRTPVTVRSSTTNSSTVVSSESWPPSSLKRRTSASRRVAEPPVGRDSCPASSCESSASKSSRSRGLRDALEEVADQRGVLGRQIEQREPQLRGRM